MRIQLLIVTFLFIIDLTINAKEKADFIVAKDGTGNFQTIQEAINTAPENSSKPFLILIKNGVYKEKVYI